MEEKDIRYGDGATTGNYTDQVVSFAITKSAETKGTKGDKGTGVIEFNQYNQSIHVNGVQYGGQDTIAQATNNLRMFSAIGGIEAQNNSDAITFGSATDSSVKISANGKQIVIGLGAATENTLGGIKSGDDITVAESGAVTVNHATNADYIDIADNTLGGGEKILVGKAGSDSSLTAIDSLSVVKVTGENDAVSYKVNYGTSEIATKKDVEDVSTYLGEKISDIVLDATDGMHYKGAVSSALPEKEGAKKGDFYIVSTDFTVGNVKYEAGDYLVYNGSDWDVINRNITETNAITVDTSALIPTSGAVKTYVDDNVKDISTAINGLKYVTYIASDAPDVSIAAAGKDSTVKVIGDSSIITTSIVDGQLKIAHSTLEVSAKTGANVDVTLDASVFNVVTGIENDAHGHVKAVTTSTVDLSSVSKAINDNATEISTIKDTMSASIYWYINDAQID